MKVAIYARKSTEQNVSDEAKSVTRQVDNARAFATARGWIVLDQHVYVDDGISGAETTRLVQKQRLLDTIASGHAPFDAIVLQAHDRWSRRGGVEAIVELKQVIEAGVAVWFYGDGQRFEYGTFESNISAFMKGEFAAEFRRAIALKTKEAMDRVFKQGHVTGNRVFGYDNIEVLAPSGKRDYVERRINDEQAAVIREIYERYAGGEGYRAIAWRLNARKALSPRAQLGRPNGWDQGSVRTALDRSIYRGVVTWNRSKKRTSDGRVAQKARPRSEWQTCDVPHLRIIPVELAAMVDLRRGSISEKYLRATNGTLIGRPSAGAKYLLSGILGCPCGARFEALKGGNWSFRGAVYACAARRRKGPAVCANDVAFPITEADEAILDVVEGTLLEPEYVDMVLESAFSTEAEDLSAFRSERARVGREVENLTHALAEGGDISALVKALREREKRLRFLDAKLVPGKNPDREKLRQALLQRTLDWRRVLRENVPQGRLVLQQLLTMPIMVASNADRPCWIGEPRPEGLLAGMVHGVASPPGIEPGSQP